MNTNNKTYQSNYLALSWSTSRGQDTFGYNICRLDDRATDKRYKCMGGGYDMVGTVVAEYLQEAFQVQLLVASESVTGLYGAKAYSGKVVIDGACGLESIKRIAEAIGVTITNNYNKRKERTEGFFISWGA